jgi:hypothetical protein
MKALASRFDFQELIGQPARQEVYNARAGRFYGNRASRQLPCHATGRYDSIVNSILRLRYGRDQKSIIGTGRESGGWG